VGKYVLEGGHAGIGGWRRADTILPCRAEHATRREAEAELKIRKQIAGFRRLELRVTMIEPDDREPAREARLAVPGSNGKGPVTVHPAMLRMQRAQPKAGKK